MLSVMTLTAYARIILNKPLIHFRPLKDDGGKFMRKVFFFLKIRSFWEGVLNVMANGKDEVVLQVLSSVGKISTKISLN